MAACQITEVFLGMRLRAPVAVTICWLVQCCTAAPKSSVLLAKTLEDPAEMTSRESLQTKSNFVRSRVMTEAYGWKETRRYLIRHRRLRKLSSSARFHREHGMLV